MLKIFTVTESCTSESIFFQKYDQCQNGGTSVKTNKNPFCKCLCPDGYFGNYCEKGRYDNWFYFDLGCLKSL